MESSSKYFLKPAFLLCFNHVLCWKVLGILATPHPAGCTRLPDTPPPLSACCGLQALVCQWPSGWSPRPFPGPPGRLPQELPSCHLANYSLLSLPTMLPLVPGPAICPPNFICRLLDIWLVLPPLLVASLLMPVTACPSCDQAPHLRTAGTPQLPHPHILPLCSPAPPPRPWLACAPSLYFLSSLHLLLQLSRLLS